MPTYINVGCYADNQRIPSKAKLKLMVKETPELVRFDQTSNLGRNGLPRTISLDDLSEFHELSVVGPDPYKARNWYANIKCNAKGIWVVS